MQKILLKHRLTDAHATPAHAELTPEEFLRRKEITWEEFCGYCKHLQRLRVETIDQFVTEKMGGKRAANWIGRICAASETQLELKVPGDGHRRIFLRPSKQSLCDISYLQTLDFIRFSGDIASTQGLSNIKKRIYIQNAVIDDPYLELKNDDGFFDGIRSIEKTRLALDFALRKFQVYDFMWDLDLVGSMWKIQPLKSIKHGFPGSADKEDVLDYLTAMLDRDYERAEGLDMTGIIETIAAGTSVEVVERYQGRKFDLIKICRSEDSKELWTITAALSSPRLP
jgi:hypothetical protein